MEKFKTFLIKYREKSGLNKTALAEKLGISLTVVIDWEKGKQKPPPIDRCREIAGALSLSHAETRCLIDAAMEERLSQEAVEWLHEKQKKQKIIEALMTPDIVEALKNPIAVRALLFVYRSDESAKKIINKIVTEPKSVTKEDKRRIMKIIH